MHGRNAEALPGSKEPEHVRLCVCVCACVCACLVSKSSHEAVHDLSLFAKSVIVGSSTE